MTTVTTGRIRRSVRFAQVEHRGAQANPKRQRFTEADHLDSRAYQQTQDWTGGMGESPSGRFRVVEKGERKHSPVSREGIRKDWGRISLMILAALLMSILLLEMAGTGLSRISVRKLNTQIEAMEVRNEELRAALERSSADISVCTEAVKMNLVSSNGVRPIMLTAPEGARMVLTETRVETETTDIRASVTGAQGD